MFSISRASCRRSSARLSVSLLATVCSLIWASPARAETVVLPQPTYTNLYAQIHAWARLSETNILFVEAADNADFWTYLDYIDDTALQIVWDAETCCDLIDGALADWWDALSQLYGSMPWDAVSADVSVVIADALDAFIVAFEGDVQEQLGQAWEVLRGTIQYEALEITNDVARVRSMVRESRPGEFFSGVEVGLEPSSYVGAGGECSCPDYTPLLQAMRQSLASIEQYAREVHDWIDDFSLGFMSRAIREFDAPGTNSWGTLGDWLAQIMGASQAVYNRDLRHLNVVSSNVLSHILDGWPVT